MTNREKIIKELTYCLNEGKCTKCEYTEKRMFVTCRDVVEKILALLKEQEVRELTVDEWREWKNNPKRNPICELWEHDTSPMWVLNPNTIHEPALLMGKLKLFTGKPTFEQCKAVKWDEQHLVDNEMKRPKETFWDSLSEADLMEPMHHFED